MATDPKTAHQDHYASIGTAILASSTVATRRLPLDEEGRDRKKTQERNRKKGCKHQHNAYIGLARVALDSSTSSCRGLQQRRADARRQISKHEQPKLVQLLQHVRIEKQIYFRSTGALYHRTVQDASID
ncbi:hypothetical protein LTR37_001543 [Vermiconidia calcicola]|uniref:Uncharacterized protein n=1 Tax=Vermiconidia calcicola TaxID=1690605 RepID=A0ACC3NWS7_9PEZI|nr:hypothetical protein LTR37_001543 [Vermiconidia calcicola]